MINISDATVKYSEAGIGKAKMKIGKMFILAFMAGMFISLAGMFSVIASATVDNHSLQKLISALVFPAGLAMVIINSTELFTGNNLMVISVLDKRISIGGMLRNWVVVYIGNFAGSLFVSVLGTMSHVYAAFDKRAAKSALITATAKCNLGFEDAFVRAIFCNILVCVAVMMAMTAETSAGKIAALYLPIALFVACGFEHSIANMGYISSGLVASSLYGHVGVDITGLTWFNFIFANLIPVTLGNIVGGLATGTYYWFTGRKTK